MLVVVQDTCTSGRAARSRQSRAEMTTFFRGRDRHRSGGPRCVCRYASRRNAIRVSFRAFRFSSLHLRSCGPAELPSL